MMEPLVSIDEFLKSDYSTSESQYFDNMVQDTKELIKESNEPNNKKRKRGQSPTISKRDNLNSELDQLEKISTTTIEANISNKIKKDRTLDENNEDNDAVDGVGDIVNYVAKTSKEVSEKVKDLKTIVKSIIGGDLITSITQLVKGLIQHVKSNKNVSVTYINKILESIRIFIVSIGQLRIV